MSLITFLHCLLWSDKIPPTSTIVPWCYAVVWIEITIHCFSQYIPSNREVKQMKKQSSRSDELSARSRRRSPQVGLTSSQARVLAVFPHSGLSDSFPPCSQCQGHLAEQGGAPLPPLAQSGREQTQAAEQSSSKDRLEPTTAACWRFLRENRTLVWSVNFRTSLEARQSWWVDAGTGAGPFSASLETCRMLTHPASIRDVFSKLAGAGTADR